MERHAVTCEDERRHAEPFPLEGVGLEIRFVRRALRSGWRADRVTALGLIQVPEGRQIIAPMTVYENLIIGARRETLKADLDEIYARFPRLYERREQKAGLLSGGEQQMLAVGRALMMHPRLLMLDEPSMGLAPLMVNEVVGYLRKLGTARTAVEGRIAAK